MRIILASKVGLHNGKCTSLESNSSITQLWLVSIFNPKYSYNVSDIDQSDEFITARNSV